jgi:hypothetical protein
MSIKLPFDDHEPKHVHVLVGGDKAKVGFDGVVLEGNLEFDKLKKLRKWLIKRQSELNVQWDNAIGKRSIERIKP